MNLEALGNVNLSQGLRKGVREFISMYLHAKLCQSPGTVIL